MADLPGPTQRQVVTLAALLHDIGKFAQRAHVPLGAGFRQFDRDVYGEHGAHAMHSAQFAEQELQPQLRPCLAPILYHHKPADNLARLVAAADRLSAAERLADQSSQNAVFQPLTNVLASLFAGTPASRTPHGHFRLARLDPGDADAFFPSPAPTAVQNQERDYAALWQEFLASHRQLEQTDFALYLAGLYSLLQAYTWCIPSAAFRSVPDISLFDHSRTTAAIAAALVAYQEDCQRRGVAFDPLTADAEACFCLVVGDLSGIQRYLYDVASDGAARRLRARSLYLQVIVEIAAQQILREAGLPFLNALMSSGGRFHLLLPNTEPARAAAASAQARVDAWLLREFGGELALNLAAMEFAPADFETTRTQAGFGSVLEKASLALASRKEHRLQEALAPGGRWDEAAFVLPGFGGARACGVCGKRPSQPGQEQCAHCAADEALGRALPHAAWLAFYDHERPGAVHALGHSVEAASRGDAPGGNPYLVLALGEYDPKLAARFPLLLHPICNYVPVWSQRDLQARPPVADDGARPGAVVAFAELAHRATGRPLLAFVKADVDRLGETFVFGLKPGRDTSSRLAQMSRMLDLFFSGWLPHRLRQDFPDCYSVYAGGDDLLLVGPWDQALSMVTTINDDFARLCQNPELHLSAGVCLARHGYPIARAAEDAEEALEAAKGAGRNRLHILGYTLAWDQWKAIMDLWRALGDEARAVPNSFLYRLLLYSRLWRRYAEWERDPTRGSVLGLRFQPLLAYDLSRNLPQPQFPALRAFAADLLALRPADARQRLVLDNLGLLAQLWLLERRGAGRD